MVSKKTKTKQNKKKNKKQKKQSEEDKDREITLQFLHLINETYYETIAEMIFEHKIYLGSGIRKKLHLIRRKFVPCDKCDEIDTMIEEHKEYCGFMKKIGVEGF